MYDGWHISKWETPVVGMNRLLMVSLADVDRELVVVLENAAALGRPQWRVRFRRYPGYRNLDEAYRIDLWRWLDESGQRCGSTFTVEESPPFASWGTGYLHDVLPGTRHFVVATEDDVVEVLAAEEPIWETAKAADRGRPLLEKRGISTLERTTPSSRLCTQN